MSRSESDGDTDFFSDADTEVDESVTSSDPYCLLFQLIFFNVDYTAAVTDGRGEFNERKPNLTCADVFVCLHDCFRKKPKIDTWSSRSDAFWCYWTPHYTDYSSEYKAKVYNLACCANYDQFEGMMLNMRNDFKLYAEGSIPPRLRVLFNKCWRTKFDDTTLSYYKHFLHAIFFKFYLPYGEYMQLQEKVAKEVCKVGRNPMNPKRRRVALLL